MAEEFVDLYAVLDLPVDADRGTVRKRINELYLDAQRNIDHRNFATRVKFQELFEVTLPQARYILLDDGRRDEYNRLVNAFRSPGQLAGSAPSAPTPDSAPADTIPLSTGGFSLETIPDSAPTIPPLPQTPVDPAQLAQEREELWKKWKSGLEAALTDEAGDKPKARGAVTAAPTSFSVMAPPEATPAPATTPVPAPTPAATPAPAAPVPKAAPRPKVTISLGSTDKQAVEEAAEAKTAAGTSIFGEEVATGPSQAEIDARRNDHKLQITKEILVNVSLIWGIIGAALVIVPGTIGLIAAVGHYYPRGAKALLGYPSTYLWIGGFLLISVAAFFASRELSRKMRQKKASELSALSYEEVLVRHHPKA